MATAIPPVTPAGNPLLAKSRQLWSDLERMVTFVQGQGKAVPDDVLQVLSRGADAYADPMDARILVQAHSRLATQVAPVTPVSLAATQAGDGSRAGLLDVPVLKWMIIACAVALIGFVGSTALVFTSEGGRAVAKQVGYLCAAALGAGFFGLYTANGYVSARTFDPSYGTQYWVRFALGVLAGTILSNFVNVQALAGANAGGEPLSALLTANVVALLGGYSADVVHRILTRLVETLETLVAGRATDVVESQKRAIEARVKAEGQQQRVAQASELMSVYDRLGQIGAPDEIRNRVKDLLDKTLQPG